MVSVDNVYEFALRQQYAGSYLYNIVHLRVKQAPVPAQADFLAVANAFKEAFRPSQASTCTWVDWKATQVSGGDVTYDATTCRRSGGDVFEGVFTGTLTGGDTSGAPDASFMAMVCALKTGFAGRSRRGSIYIGGWDANAQLSTDRNLFTTTKITAIQTALTALITAYSGTGGTSAFWDWVVWSRFIASGCKYVAAVPRPLLTHVQAGSHANSFKSVTTATPRSAIVPMNRRKVGVGI